MSKQSQYITKWINLSYDPKDPGKPKKIIDTIINDKIHMSLPKEFNDRFDSQLHLHEDETKKLGEYDDRKIEMVNVLLTIFEYLTLTTSFSLLAPDTPDSNHMWGLYARNGKDFALVYSRDELNNQIETKDRNNIPTDRLFYKIMAYPLDYSPYSEFEKCVRGYLRDNKLEILMPFLDKFIFSKTQQWKFEGELRICKMRVESLQGIAGKYQAPKSKDLKEYFEKNSNPENSDRKIDFIKPRRIVLGWECNIEDKNIKKLIEYGKRNGIPIEKLEPYINYSDNKFHKVEL
jgi:hypothetical protein